MKIVPSTNALASVAAALQNHSRERTEEEQRFDAVVDGVVFKSYEHAQMPAPPKVAENGGRRLYTVTTIAASARFGGNRTVTVCDSFDRAKEIIETNEGDLFECSYRLAVIDTIVAGWLYFDFDEQYWFCWVGDSETGCYKAIDRPKAYENVANVGGIG